MQLNKLFNSEDLGVAILNASDLSNFFYKMNDTLKQFFLYSEEELNKLNLFDISHSEDMAKTLENGRKILNREIKEFSYQKRYLRSDGSYFWGLTSVTRISDCFLLFVVKDISKMKSLEEEIRNTIEPFTDDIINDYCSDIKHQQIPEEDDSHNRQFFRVKLIQPICTELVIEQMINGARANFRPTNVCIRDIGPGGLRFHTDLQLPVHEEFSLYFAFKLLGQDVRVTGNIVRARQIHKIYEYGVSFDIAENHRDKLTRLLNNLTILYRNKVKIYDTALCQEPCFSNK